MDGIRGRITGGLKTIEKEGRNGGGAINLSENSSIGELWKERGAERGIDSD